MPYSYAEYDSLLKKKDSWIELQRQCSVIAEKLQQYGVLGGDELGGDVRSHLKKARKIILEENAWCGEDMVACVNTISSIQNEVTHQCEDVSHEINHTLYERAGDIVSQYQTLIARCAQDLDAAGQAEAVLRSVFDSDMKR